MMNGVEPRHLTLWEYEAMVAGWTERHSKEGPGVEPPDKDKVRRALRIAASDPRLVH